MSWQRTMWWAWGVGALIWLIFSYMVFSPARTGVDEYNLPTRSPLLASPGCDRMGDLLPQQGCAGVTALARERQAMFMDQAAYRTAIAGLLIVGPLVLSLVIVILITRYYGTGQKPVRRPYQRK